MSAAERPWWASEVPGEDTGDDDPLTAHRRARRGAGDGSSAGDGGWWEPAADAVGRFARDLGAGSAAGPTTDDDGDPVHRIDACGVCPICVGMRVLGDARPELVGHLTEAARQLALAVRTVVDAAVDGGQAAAPDGGEPLERIDLDD